MSGKLQNVQELMEERISALWKNPEDYVSFLETASRLYKYSFKDQILIHAQRPDAVACAEYDTWGREDITNRYVKRGSKGIALIKEENGRAKLRYVFDFADTAAKDERSRTPFFWKVTDENEDAVIKRLSPAADYLGEAVRVKTDELVRLHSEEYLAGLLEEKDNTFLAGLDDMSIRFRFEDLLKTSVSYTVLTRCGYDAEALTDLEDLRGLYEFNSIKAMTVLGDAVSTISEQILRSVEMTLKAELIKNNEQGLSVESNKENEQELSTERSKNNEHSITENNDRERDSVPSGRNDTDISSRLEGGRTERDRQVRTSQENVPEGKEELGVSGDADRRNSELTSGGDRRDSTEENRPPASADDEGSRSNGRAEGERSDGLGRNSEQPESSDRGTDPSRTDIRLKENTELKAVSEDNSDAAFSVSGDISAADEFFDIEPETEETGGYAGQEQLSLFSGMENFYGMMEEISDLARDDDYSDLVGEYIEYDGGRYKVTDFKDDIGGKRLELQDIDNTDWFPVFRTVPLEELYENGYRYLDKKDFEEKISLQETPSETNDKADKPETAGTGDKAEITGEKHDFRIIDEDLGTGGAKTKYKANVEAIKLLNTLETENRYASPEEQEVLSKYVGWGGMPQAFDANNSSWSAEYNELRSLLSPEEYENAKASTLTAFYTSPAVISAVYEGLENLGFKEGNVLEPAMGVGNFFGMMPNEMRNSRLYGVELDSISGKIAKQLYQTADIQVTGFEKTQFPDNFFDVAVGNVPFGQFKLSEKRYDKLNLNIHDHFFAKSLDKVRAGGVIAFVTSKGTLDKANPNFRKYLAQRAELIGAIRLPNNAFKDNAGTEVTSDIIFLQKRDKMLDIEPDWVHLGTTADGVPVNRYFEEHPEMILGEMKQGLEFSMYGNSEETACVPVEGADLKEQLKEAVRNIQGHIPEAERDDDEKAVKSIPADPDVKNFSYTVIDGNIYYRENSRMFLKEDLPKATSDRIKGMVELRDCVRTLIDYQLNEYSDADIRDQQRKLNDLYDSFTKKYGLINSRGNANAFSDDSSYYLLSSLEVLDENGELERKADMFTKRTIKQKAEIHSVDTASEALAVSISEKAAVDMPFMEELTGKTEDELYNDLKGVIFLNPLYNAEDGVTGKYLPADEYLSGNIREKLEIAKRTAELSPEDYSINVEALTNAMPKPLEASEIDVRLGATWIDTDIIKQFISETLQVPRYMQRMFDVHFSKFTSEWQIEGKNNDRSNVMANVTFGTGRKNAYSIIEDTLNLRDARVYDRVEQPDGKITSVLNKKETMIAQEKQEAIKNAFRDWIFKDPDRREKLVNRYNTLFNSSRPREYDGSHITFSGMTPEIKLRPHQLNAIAHVMYGGNTLLAHQVGAGKSFEMIASAMESKRLGLCTKSLFVVPNHLTEQMGAEFLRLYPAANILVATKKDFEAKNRKKLCSKIATGDYDAVIIGHSQLEKIPVSAERQERIIRKQINEITEGIEELSRRRGDSFSIKQLEKTKKNLEAKLDKLTSMERDDVVTFEELGIDKMFVDEAHSFKNLFLYTKMRNVAGIQQTEAQKSSDLYMKCQYLDELTGGKGCTFATGTPVSNSMTELYTMMRYLQADKLKEMGMNNFDAWAANFGEAVTAIELAPEGTGYRAKTRFSKFFNLPELINVFKECADIKTADMLNLPVPEAEFHNVVVKPSDIQKEMVEGLSERAKLIHDKAVAPETDNMLKVTNDGRKIGLDQRLIDPLLPDAPDSKVNACVTNVLDIYHRHDDTKATQLIFCDFSTPKNDGSFNLYDDIRNKLVTKGVPKEEVVFIHEADSETKKKELFSKIRKGQVRVLIGSTAKCRAGTNIQDKLIALHHLDCPWRPSDLERAPVKATI